MARKPRLHVAGGVYHVMVRGNGGQDIFFDEADRSHLYLLLHVEDLRGPARTRVLSEACRTISWLARYFGTATIQEVVAYFDRDASTCRRRLSEINAAVRGREGEMPQLKKYIRALTQA